MTTQKKKEAIEMERNWTDLPPELFSLILKKLPEICDFIRSRTVCKSWCLFSSVFDLPPQFPWILRHSKGPDLEFYSIIFNKVYTIRAHCSSGKRLFRPAGSYLLSGEIGNDNNFFLLNPLNNRDVHIPVLQDCHKYYLFSFPWINSPSFQIDGHIYVSEHEISVRCKPGDDKWSIIGPGHECQYSCYYLKGFLFRVCYQTGVTKIMDISDRRQLYAIPPPKYEEMSKMYFRGPFLVESCGEILTVSFHESNSMTVYKFYIHRLEYQNGKEKPYWVKLSNIGDRILFFEIPLGYGRAFSLRASDFSGFKGNCIYFINKYIYAINMYDIENGETIFIDTSFNRERPINWFMPTLNHI